MTGDLRWARDLAAAIGFVTALVAFGKLLASGWSSWSSLLPWLGWAYLALILAGGVFGALRPAQLGVSRWKMLLVVLPVTAAIIWSAAVDGDRTYLYVLGGLGAAVGLASGLAYYVVLQRKRASSVKTCPDCAEQVKAKALVCRYCRYRFPVDDEGRYQGDLTAQVPPEAKTPSAAASARTKAP